MVEDPRNHQGRYGEAYFNTLAVAAGVVASPLSGGDDIEGIDFYASLPRDVRGRRYPMIGVQVKTTASPKLSMTRSVFKFRGLDEVGFNDLAGDGFQIPRFLVVVVVPPNDSEYARATTEALQLRYAAYWLSLADRELVAHPRRDRKVTVDVPRQNLLTVESLLRMFEPATSEATEDLSIIEGAL